jgi:cell pole-organizing protein PopZ
MQDRQDPSMEDILASIKKVIAEEKELRAAIPRSFGPAPEEEGEDDGESDQDQVEEVLELDQPFAEEMNLPQVDLGPPLVSSGAAEVSRSKLEELQQVAASAPLPPQVSPLEAVVREMLRPVLKEWLDKHLPAIVDEHVKREISRITGQRF